MTKYYGMTMERFLELEKSENIQKACVNENERRNFYRMKKEVDKKRQKQKDLDAELDKLDPKKSTHEMIEDVKKTCYRDALVGDDRARKFLLEVRKIEKTDSATTFSPSDYMDVLGFMWKEEEKNESERRKEEYQELVKESLDMEDEGESNAARDCTA